MKMRSLSRRNETDLHRMDRRKRYRKIVTSLAAVVVFATTYALVLPAMTLDDQKAEETPGIETQTQTVEQAAPEKQEAASEQNADSGSQAGVAQKAEAPVKEPVSEDSLASNDSGSAVKSEKTDSGVEQSRSENASSNNDADREAADEDKDDKDEAKLIDEKTDLIYSGNGYKIVAEVGADAKLPADTKLKVREIRKDTRDENGEKND